MAVRIIGAKRKAAPYAKPELFLREEFMRERFIYHPGDHVAFVAPTQAGKTTFAFQLLEGTATPDLPVLVLVMKPRDPVVQQWMEYFRNERGWRRVRTWPPILDKKRAGYILWPKHKFDPGKDNPALKAQFRRAILWAYRKGNCIIFADEVYGLSSELKLDDELISIWSRGSGMGTGLWGATQKPSHVPLWMYSQSEHLFLARDPDKRARIRFGEIGGINPRQVEDQVMQLPKYHWLYIHRTGPEWCIVGP